MPCPFRRPSRALASSLALAFLLFCLPASAAERTRLRVDDYQIDAELTPHTHKITARAKVKFTALETINAASFELHNGSAQVSLVVGRASLQHFLHSRATKILGCAMNSCSYYLLVHPSISGWQDLKGKIIACREGPARNTPWSETLANTAQLDLGRDLTLALPQSDLDAFKALVNGSVQAALLPRPYGFLAEEKGFKRLSDWPDVVDDPLPITIETTEKLLKQRGHEFAAFLAAHREGIRYMKSHRAKTTQMLQDRFNHVPALAGKTFDLTI